MSEQDQILLNQCPECGGDGQVEHVYHEHGDAAVTSTRPCYTCAWVRKALTERPR